MVISFPSFVLTSLFQPEGRDRLRALEDAGVEGLAALEDEGVLLLVDWFLGVENGVLEAAEAVLRAEDGILGVVEGF